MTTVRPPAPACSHGGPDCCADRGSDRGAGSVLVLGVVLVAVALAVAAVGLAQALAARHRAEAAADLAALAAASAWPEPDCARASAVGRANGAQVVSCTADPASGTARVTAQVLVRGAWAALGPATATALAGPSPGGPPAAGASVAGDDGTRGNALRVAGLRGIGLRGGGLRGGTSGVPGLRDSYHVGT